MLSNREVLAVSDDPLAREAVRLADQPGHIASVGEVYVGPTATGFAVVLFNREAIPMNMTLALADFVPAQSKLWKVRDVWQHTDNGTLASDGKLLVTVPPEDVVMVTLRAA